jgi:hypothetical protein
MIITVSAAPIFDTSEVSQKLSDTTRRRKSAVSMDSKQSMKCLPAYS